MRIETGIPTLDNALSGGLLPGTLTVVMGATGIGKTQLGLQFANHGLKQEGQRGIIYDMTSRGDSQNHTDYAKRLCDWNLTALNGDEPFQFDSVWNSETARRDYLHIFSRGGRRVTLSDLTHDQWREFKADLARRLDRTIGFFYGNFVHGVRRCVIDGIEPTDRMSDSFQIEQCEYIYEQVLKKEHDWLARDLFRVHYRTNAAAVQNHAYDNKSIAGLLLYTTHETMLDQLIERPIQSGDLLSNANTVILMGKTRHENKVSRGLHVAKHRGSPCSDDILDFAISEAGIEFTAA
ncbi:MAG: RAD55 family ATPase [Planctomycetaceae bacterium]